MKKVLLVLLALVLSISFLGCNQDDGIKKVGFLTPYASTGFMAMLAGGLEETFEADGWEWNIGVADGDSNKQIEQIENMITLGVDVLVIMAVDPTALKDVVQEALDEDIHVINFTTDPGVGSIFVGSDEFLIGEEVAGMASDWIDEEFADAADGSVKVAVLEFNGTPEAAHRSDGLQEISNNSKVDVVLTQEVENTRTAAMAAIENILLTNPDIDVVLTYNTGMALGVNDYLTSESSPISDLSNFAVFGSDNDPEVLAEIQASATDESVLRGATQLGGPITDTFQIILGFANDLYEGTEVPEEDIAEVFPITVSNVEDYVH